MTAANTTDALLAKGTVSMATPAADANTLASLKGLAGSHCAELTDSNGGAQFFFGWGSAVSDRARLVTELRSIGYRARDLASLDSVKVWL